jgi:hypothetical protein
MGDMPDVRSPGQVERRAVSRQLVALVTGCLTFMIGCSGGGETGIPASGAPASPAAIAMATVLPRASGDEGVSLCQHVAAVEERLAALEAVELRLPNRVALDIELGKLQAAFGELRQADLGPFEEQLESPLQRLGYRLTELELAVEDFRTNSRPQQAVSHVETDALTFGEELAAFTILSRC